MVLEIFFTVLLLLIVLFINQCWIKPRKTMKFYEDQLRSMKYNSEIVPYKLFYNCFVDPILKGKKNGDPYQYFKKQFCKYDIGISNIMNKPCIEIGHIDFLKDFYSLDKHYQFPKVPIFIDPLVKLFGNTVGLSEGKIWKQKRTILNKIFNFQFIKKQIPNIVEICDIRMKQMEEKAKKGIDGSDKYVQCNILHDLLIKIFSSAIFTGFLGFKKKDEIQGVEVIEFLLRLIDDISVHRFISPTIVLGNWFYQLQVRKIDKSINRRKKILRQWGKKVIKQQLVKLDSQIKENGPKIEVDNIFKSFILYKRQNNISDEEISEQDIFTEFLGFIFAGTDTTANFLNAMLCFIAKNPEVQAKLRKQIEQNLNDDYSFDNLKKFQFIDALQKETIRIYGPANILFLRQAINDNYLNGLAVKKGTIIYVNTHGNHFSQKYFKQPSKFRPERWVNGECDNLDPFVSTGFGAGARTCIGKHLALLQSKIALIKIMKRYKKIKLEKQDFKWDIKFFAFPQTLGTKLTINEENNEFE